MHGASLPDDVMPDSTELAPTEPDTQTGVLRCLRCRTYLTRTGREAYRFECLACGAHFFAVLQLVPVEPERPRPLLEISVAEPGSGTE